MFWRSAQPKAAGTAAPAPMPGLSLERFLADPTPIIPSPRGAVHHFTTGNVEMWPPPNCEAVLPPVGGGMPAMPSASPMSPPAMPAPVHPVQVSPPAVLAPESVAHYTVGPATGQDPGAAATSLMSTSEGGTAGTNVIAWMDVGCKPLSTGRRCSGGMPNLPPTAPWVSTAQSAEEVLTMGKLPPTWTSTIQEPQAAEEPREESQLPPEEPEEDVPGDEVSREELLAKLKVAKQTLLWERAVTQRLRNQLDMAEAWSSPHTEEEVHTLKAQIASLVEENQRLKDEADESSEESSEVAVLHLDEVKDAQAEVESLQQKLNDSQVEVEDLKKQVLEEQQKAQEQVAQAQNEATTLRQQLEDSTAKAAEEAQVIKAAVAELKEKLQELVQSQERSAASDTAHRAVEEELQQKLREMEAKAKEEEKFQEQLRLQLRTVEANAKGSQDTAQADFQLQLRHVEAAAKSERDKMEEDLRSQLRHLESAASEHETAQADFQLQLRHVEAAAKSERDTMEEDLRSQLRHLESAASEHETAQADLREKLRKTNLDTSEHEKEKEDLLAQLRKMEAGAEEKEKVEADLREKLRKTNLDTSEHEKEKVHLRHVQSRNNELESELQEFQQVRLRTAKVKEVEEVAVQTDAAPERGIRSARQKKKSVFFSTAPESGSSLPGATELESPQAAADPVEPSRRHFKSVDFGQHDEDVSYTPISGSDDDDGDGVSYMTSRTSMMSQVSECYDMYSETSQPSRSRARSTIEQYHEDDMWDPAHVAMVTKKLFRKHDIDRTGRIDWASGEAKKFLEEFFWLHKQPPPKIPNAPFQSLYDQVKSENEGYGNGDNDDDKGLNMEEMTAFAIKVHQFVYKQLGKEMRMQRKSFAVTEEELATLHRASIEMNMGEDAQAAAARMMRRTTIMAPPDLSKLTESS